MGARTSNYKNSFINMESITDLVKRAEVSGNVSDSDKVKQDLEILQNTLNTSNIDPNVADLIMETLKDIVFIYTKGQSDIIVKRKTNGDV